MAKATRPIQYDKTPAIERGLLKISERVYPTGDKTKSNGAVASPIAGSKVGGSMEISGGAA